MDNLIICHHGHTRSRHYNIANSLDKNYRLMQDGMKPEPMSNLKLSFIEMQPLVNLFGKKMLITVR